MAHILILDRYRWVRELHKEELVDDGHRVEAIDPLEWVEERARDFKPDLILVDLYMGGSGRWDVLRQLRHSYPSLPILVVTALEIYRQDYRSVFADGFVTKSSNCDGLKRKIALVLKKNEKEIDFRLHFCRGSKKKAESFYQGS